jgi:uncharacterized protein
MARKIPRNEDRTLQVLTHVIGIFSYIFGALLVFLLTKDRKVKRHAVNALNWQISVAIFSVILLTASSISSLVINTFPNVIIMFPFALMLSVLTILNIVFSIIAALKANEGQYWKYPLAWDIIGLIDEKEISKGKREIGKAYREVRRDLKKEFGKK